MSGPPLVSVVIPVRDGERYLRAAVDTALAQSHPRVEVIVVDDGSADGSRAVAEAYGDAVRCASGPARGIGPARNRGIDLARGDFLAFLDSDDLWPPDRVALQLARLSSDPSLDMVFGHVRHFRVPGDLEPPCPAHLATTMLIHRAAWDRVGPYSSGHEVGEFLEWLLRARELGLREAIYDDAVLERRVHGDNLTARSDLSAYAYILKASLDRRRAQAGGQA